MSGPSIFPFAAPLPVLNDRSISVSIFHNVMYRCCVGSWPYKPVVRSPLETVKTVGTQSQLRSVTPGGAAGNPPRTTHLGATSHYVSKLL